MATSWFWELKSLRVCVYFPLFCQHGGVYCSPSWSDCPEEEIQGVLVSRWSSQHRGSGPYRTRRGGLLWPGSWGCGHHDGNIHKKLWCFWRIHRRQEGKRALTIEQLRYTKALATRFKFWGGRVPNLDVDILNLFVDQVPGASRLQTSAPLSVPLINQRRVLFIVFLLELHSKAHPGLRTEYPLVWKSTQGAARSHSLLLSLSCARYFRHSRHIMGASGTEDQFLALLLDSNASWVSIKTGRKELLCWLWCTTEHCLCQSKNYIMNSGVFENQYSMVGMVEPWRQNPRFGFEYFPNFVRPWAKYLMFKFPCQ